MGDRVGSKSPRTSRSDSAATAGSAAKGAAAVEELQRRAELHASRGEYSAALQLVEEALRLEPRRAELHHGRGQCLLSLERFEDAEKTFEEALQLEPGHRLALRGQSAAAVRQRRWGEAAACLRETLAAEPSDREVRVELARCLTEQGVQCKLEGRGDPQLFREALLVWEGFAPAYFQLGVEASGGGENAKARELYTKAVQLDANYVEAWNNLGVTCRMLADHEAALEAYGMALKVNQNCKKTRENMATCLLEIGCRHLERKQHKEASGVLKRALSYNVENADVYFNLGVMYAELSKLDRARVNYELATHFAPKHSTAWNNLGVILRRQANPEAALRCFETALEADSKNGLASKNLGAMYGTLGRMSDSIRLTRQAIEVCPQDAEAHNNLALLYRDRCDVDACIEHLQRCLELDPDNQHANSNYLMTLNYPSEKSPEEVFEAHRTWGERFEKSVAPTFTSWATLEPQGRTLRVGYISPDFFTHSVSYFIHAALRFHDPQFVHVTCYSDVAVEDDKTRLFRSLVPRWRNIHGMPSDEVANLIHDDKIDILVELTGHTGNNRLSCLARRPAPVVVTWMGYPHTTGLSRVDFRISDKLVDPPDAPGRCTEEIVYLPECFLCYTPPENAPAVGLRPPQEAYGCPTFGCFNNLAKISSLTIRLWCRVLLEVPNARLFLKAKAFSCPEVREAFRKRFAAHGVEGPRLDFSGLLPQTGSHLQMYNLVDVALDTAPYAGTTTTCEALYMGVPVVTLRGHGVHAQGVGASLLHAVQLEDMVATTEDEFVAAAAALARNTTKLAALRAGLRTRMLRSPLCDGPKHVARLERLYSDIVARPDVRERRGCGSAATSNACAANASAVAAVETQ
eukprot:TRINITY_DN20819_c0_g2_i1.p1 TRINITY_DN20819_c0_g2~~TRINITY_DN20819_c0_g2_i1.p1  ORF type:complete len:877 (+),score=152.73 TRINITY_DN20819_c0_g2_i1:54-2633(+)